MSPKLVVILGGNGYLGQRIVSNILKKGANVVSISRSGLPPPLYKLPSDLPSDVSVTWHKGTVPVLHNYRATDDSFDKRN